MQYLIVGIDPGSTTGYAILNLNGKILYIDSKKNLTQSELILKLMRFGKPVVIASDVTPLPNSVKKIGRALGARVIEPEHDLTVKEKNKLVHDIKLKNKHESDALASAIHAYKRLRHLLDKIDTITEKQGIQEFNVRVKELILTKKHFNIDRAIKFVQNRKRFIKLQNSPK